MNINNIFAGILGMIMAIAFLYLFWTPINSFITAIGVVDAELGLFLQVAFVAFCFILGLIAPINLAISDDKGEQ